jgi:phosphatidylserine/phosphatidylglycerophosphate/cardiolipin synthase-like enzyme
MNDVVAYTVCRTFEVRITVGAGTSLSPVEQHVLKAIDAGVDSVTGLCDVLGLGSRLMVDLLGDLWRAGHVGFDFADERVWLTGPVRELVAADALDTLPGAEISDETQQMMLDTLSGQVIPVGGARRPLVRNMEIPQHPGEAQLGDIDQAALIEAVTRALNEDRQLAGAHSAGQRLKRVVRAYLSPASLTSHSSERHYRAVRIKAALDADGQLVARLAEDAVPGRYRENAQARLIRLIEDQPNSSFVHALRMAAGGPPQEPATLASALAELGEHALALEAVPAARRQEEHAEITAASRRIVTRLSGLAEQVSEISLLSGHAAQEAAIREMIRRAKTQVVLACPWISYRGLLPYAPLLEEAARRGVQIVLLWGIGRGDAPVGEISNALSALQREAMPSARVVISPQTSSIIHAKLVVSDAQQAVVTSLNFLDPSGPQTHELGVLVQAMPGLHSPAILEALTWARNAMPDYTVAQSIINDSASFPVAPGETEPEPLAETGGDPPLTDLARQDTPGGPAVSAWAAAWRQRAGELEVAAQRQRPSVRLVRDGEHRDILWTALRTARRQLLITSDGLAEDVVDKAFVEHLSQCLKRGVDVTLIYRRPRRESGTQAAQRLQDLSERHRAGPGRLTLVKQNNHAKVLVVDDEAVVTSFNFLSFEGYYGGVGRRRQRAEVGVRIYGGGVARQLLESFGAAPDEPAAAGSRDLKAQAGQTQLQLRAFSVTQQLLDRQLGQGERLTGRQLAGLAGRGNDGLAVLDALRYCGAAPDVLEPVVAAVLGWDDHPGEGPGSRREADDWWAWLARRRFEAQDFTVAGTLRAAVPGQEARPRSALVSVAACRATAGLSAAISDAALQEDLRPDEWSIIVTVAAYELLRTGGMDLAGVTGIALPEVSGAWAELATITLRWWETTLRPLPVDQLRRGAEQRQMIAGEVGNWADLDRQLGAFERYSPPFTAGSATQRFLLRADGPLNLLKLAADHRDRVAVRTWLADAKLKNVGNWVDAATKAAGVGELIEGHLRPPFVSRVTDIVTAARTVAEYDDSGLAPADTADETAEAARAFVRDFTALLPRLQAAATAVELPERVLAEAAVRDLERLTEAGAP